MVLRHGTYLLGRVLGQIHTCLRVVEFSRQCDLSLGTQGSATHRTCEENSVSTRPQFFTTAAEAYRAVLCHGKREKSVSQARPNFLPKATCQQNSFVLRSPHPRCSEPFLSVLQTWLTFRPSDSPERPVTPLKLRIWRSSELHTNRLCTDRRSSHTIDVVHETSRANTVSLVASLTTVIGSSSLRRFASKFVLASRPTLRFWSIISVSRKKQRQHGTIIFFDNQARTNIFKFLHVGN